MSTMYMMFWSIVIITAVGLWRLRDIKRIVVALFVTGVVLLFSQFLFVQLSINAGLDPGLALVNPWGFLAVGPLGWMALMVMPCGWLGPVIGLNLVQRWQDGSSAA